MEEYVIIDYGEYDWKNHKYKDRPYYLEFLDEENDIPYMTPFINEAQVFHSYRSAQRFIDDHLDGTCKICLKE